MMASCASLVGCFSTRGEPRIISVLALDAHRRGAAVDGVRRHELRSAPVAGKSAATVGVELLDERTPLSARITIVAEAGAPRLDRLSQHIHNRVAKERFARATALRLRRCCRCLRFFAAPLGLSSRADSSPEELPIDARL